MKATKKCFALLLAVIVVLSFSISAYAANDGSITIRNTTIGETYSLYKIFDLTYVDVPASGTEGQPDYVPAHTNVSYTYTKAAGTDDFYNALTESTSPFTLSATTNPNVYSVESNSTGEEISAFLTPLVKNGTIAPVSGYENVEAAADTYTFNNLAYGYYLITSSLANGDGRVVTIDSTLPNVTVIDKNEVPFWDNNPNDPDDPSQPSGTPNPGKVIVLANGDRVTENSVSFGDTVYFNTSLNAKAYVGTELATYYYITDTLDAGFTSLSNIAVTVYKIDSNTGKYMQTGIPLTKDTDYKLEVNGNTFNIAIPFGEIYGSAAKIEVTYNATIAADGANVKIASTPNLNTTNFTYDIVPFDPNDPPFDPKDPTDTNYPDPETKDPEDPDVYFDSNRRETETYVYSLFVKKVDTEGKPLDGAVFRLWAMENPTSTDQPIAFTETGDGRYSLNGSEFELATDSNGYLIVKGLEEGTYWLEEVESPDGYNLLNSKIGIEVKSGTVSSEYYDETTGNTVTVTTGAAIPAGAINPVLTEVTNQSGTELPSTGGIGTKVFYISGSILLVGAAILLITKKRMSVKK